MGVEGRLVGPALEQRQLVRVEHTLKDLELLAPGLPHALLAARSVRLSEFGALSRCGGDRYNESDRHIVSPCMSVECERQQYGPRHPQSRIAHPDPPLVSPSLFSKRCSALIL